MVFNELDDHKTFKTNLKYSRGVFKTFKLDAKRLKDLEKTKIKYERATSYKISHTKLIKMSIDYFIRTLEAKDDKQAMEFINQLYSSGIF